MAKRLLNIILSLALLAGLAACGQETPPDPDPPPAPPALNLPEPSDPSPERAPFTLAFYAGEAFHPARWVSKVNLTLVPLLYEGLFRLDETFQPQAVLCESYSHSEDCLVWTFVLRQEITFSDGTSLTASLTAQALNLCRTAGGSFAARLSNVSNISANRAGELVITLTRPNAQLPALLDIPIALGKDQRPLGTGPYVLVEDEEGNPLSLQAREDWWQGRTFPLESIRLLPAEQPDDLIHGFNGGELTVLNTDLTGTGSLSYSTAYELTEYATTGMVYLAFQTQEGLFRSDSARQAVYAALDREGLAEEVYGGHAVSARLPVHPDAWLYDGQDEPALDEEELQSLLARAKLEGKGIRLIVSNENPSRLECARWVAEQLEELGLNVTVDALAWDAYLAALAEGQFDLYLAEVNLSADFDLTALVGTEGALNYGGWTDWETDELLWNYAAIGGRGSVRALYEHLNQKALLIPLCFKNGCVLTQWGRLTGLSPIRGDVFHQMEQWVLLE